MNIRKAVSACAVTAALVALDQITKIWAASALRGAPVSVIRGVFELRYLENRGAAFGILQNQRWFFIALTALFLAVALYILTRLPDDRHFLPMRGVCILLIAGAVGNLIDRISLTYVRDFLYFVLIDFPIFNVADIYVTVAAGLLFYLVLFRMKDEDFDFLKRGNARE